MKNWVPYIIKSAVFAAYCLDKLEIVSCQFLAANHWSSNALELSSKVKVCDKDKLKDFKCKIPWLLQGINENSTYPLENKCFCLLSQVSAFSVGSKISVRVTRYFWLRNKLFNSHHRHCWRVVKDLKLLLLLFVFNCKKVRNRQRDGPISSYERRRHGDGPVERTHRRPRRGHGRAGLHLVLGPAQDVEARSSR